ncbi:hypothetical protein ACXYMU_09155 [Pontibacter sp. CAU 1760]
MKTKLLYLLSFAAALTLTGCPNPCINGLPLYNFQITAHFSPEQDSIQVGDTLYLVSEFEKRLRPNGSQDVVDYSNANINGSLSVIELVPNQEFATDAVFSFDYVSLGGQIYNSREIPRPDGVQQFIYQELADRYLLKIAFIPKKKGIYGLGILTVASKGRSGSDGCDNASFKTVVTNDDINDHYRREGFIGLTDSPQPDNGFYFKVY